MRAGLDLMRWYDTVTVHMVRDTDTTAPLCGAVRPAHAGGSLIGPDADHWTGYSGDDSILSRCVSCATEAERLSQTCDSDLSPEVSVPHRCPRMREHIEHAFNSGRRGHPPPRLRRGVATMTTPAGQSDPLENQERALSHYRDPSRAEALREGAPRRMVTHPMPGLLQHRRHQRPHSVATATEVHHTGGSMTLREVRERASTVVHKTFAPADDRVVRTVCGQTLGAGTHRVHTDPSYLRQWQGSTRTIRDCETCFAPQRTPEHRFRPGDRVVFTSRRNVRFPEGHRATVVAENERVMGDEGPLYEVTDADGLTTTTYAHRLRLDTDTLPVQQPQVYRCTCAHTSGNDHTHSRPVGEASTHPWDGSAGFITTSARPGTPVTAGFERHEAPDGTPYLFRMDDALPLLIEDTRPRDDYQFYAGDRVVLTSRRNVASGEVAWPEGKHATVLGPHEEDPGFGPRTGRNRWFNIEDEDGNRTYIFGHRLRLTDPVSQIRDTTTTQRESTTMPEFQTGDAVVSSRPGPGGSTTGVTPFIFADSRPAGALTIHPNYGWAISGRTSEMYPEQIRPVVGHALAWYFDLGPLRHATEEEVAAQSQAFRDLQASIRTAMGDTVEPQPQIDLYPLTYDKAREYRGREVTLHSIEGQRNGNDVVFGCQRWSLQALATEGNVITFGADNTVTVVGKARIEQDGESVFIADRSRDIGDVNDYTRHVYVDPAPAASPANAVLMPLGYYGCANHEHQILHLFRDDRGNPLLARIQQQSTASHRLTGIVGIRGGLADSAFFDCVPVFSDTTAQIMNVEHEDRYALVPATEAQRTAIAAANRRAVFGTIPGQHIVLATSEGQVIPS